MKYTNKLNLPELFLKFKEPKEYIDNRYGVTELLNSTQEIKLKRKYYNVLEEDISESINTIFGSAVHKVFEENSEEGESEVKLEVQLEGITIVGIIDHVKDDLIEDYKTCSVSKVMKKDFKDHMDQILSYAWMRFKNDGIITRKGTLYYLMKDWSKIKSIKIEGYPKSPIYVHTFDINDSDYDYIYEFLLKKIIEMKSNIVPSCSDEDRWYTGTKYAVYKNLGDKKAIIVCDTFEEAHGYITNKCDGAGEIQVRKGEYLKCKYYCLVNKYCDQYRKEEKDVIGSN